MSNVASEEAFQAIEDRAVELVRQAGQMALERFRRPLQVEYKQDDRRDPVTEADRDVERFLRESIARDFPNHGIVGEEGTEVGTDNHDLLWALDPIDGTTNFVNGLPLFGCSAGLLLRGEPVVGALFVSVAPSVARVCAEPVEGGESARSHLQLQGAVLHARLGGGAYLEGERILASDAEKPEPSSLSGLPGFHASQFERVDTLRKAAGDPRFLGSVTYEAALVACGVYRYAIFRRPKIWDVAAAVLIVREAGGACLMWQDDRWHRLTRFEPAENPAKRGEGGLRFWTGVTLVGGEQVSRYVAERLRPRQPFRKRLVQTVRGFWE